MSDSLELGIEGAKAVWEYDEALRGEGADIRAVLDNWLEERTREELAIELLRCEFEYRTTRSGSPCCRWMATRVAELSDIISTVAARHKLYRSIYNDFVEQGGRPTWNDFSTLGYDANVMLLRVKGDPVFLGQVIEGRYRLVERCAAGGFGVAFRAAPIDGGDDIVVKAPFGESPAELAESVRQLRLEANLMHAFLEIDKPMGVKMVAFLGVVELENGLPLLMMEYMSGGTWGDMISG